MRRIRAVTSIGLGLALTVAGCTSGDEDAADTTAAPATEAPATTTAAATTEAPATTAAPVDTATAETDPPPDTTVSDPYAGITGEAPGVTDTSIRVGITYVDTEALKEVGLDFNLGDHEGAFNAYADYINSQGGINGRQLELVFSKINPTAPESAEAECVRLTEDEDVFIVGGYMRGGSASCVTDIHATALVGGNPNAELQATAKAPWITPDADSDVGIDIVTAFAESGALDGTLGVMNHISEPGDLEAALSALEAAGIEPAEVATLDAPTDDTAALESAVKAVAERFKAKGVDTLLLIGAAGGAQWPNNMHPDASYRPALRFTAYNAPQAFTTSEANADADFTILDGALIGGLYGPDQPKFDEASMQECVTIIEEAGFDVIAPSETNGEQSDQPYYAAFRACEVLTLVRGWTTAAGPNLNYGTLAAVLDDGLEIALPGDPEPRTYGTANDADGNPAAFIYRWDQDLFAPVLND